MLLLLTLVFLSPVPCSKLYRRAGQNWYLSDVYETGVNKDNELFVRVSLFIRFTGKPVDVIQHETRNSEQCKQFRDHLYGRDSVNFN